MARSEGTQQGLTGSQGEEMRGLDPAIAAGGAVHEEPALAQMMKDLPAGVLAFNPAGKICYTNTAAQKILGELLPPGGGNEVEFGEAYIAGTEERYPPQRLPIRRALRGESSTVEDLEFRHKGTSLALEVSGAPIFGQEGEVRYAVAVLREITEDRRKEMVLRQANLQLQNSLQELEHYNQEINLLSQMGSLLQASVTPEEIYRIISQSIQQLFPADSGGLYIYRASRNLLEVVSAWGEHPPEERMFLPDECWGLRRGRLHLVEDPHRELGCAHAREVQAPYLCVPLMAHGESMGVLHMVFGYNPDRGERSRQLKQRLILSGAEQVSLALANLNLREILRNLSIRDPLTGLFNRRYMEESLERELHLAGRKGTPVSVVMMDLDHFKYFNDTFGHKAADTVLCKLGAQLQRGIRSSDIPCRYGGEEFVLILPESSLEAAWLRAEQLREAVKRMQIQHGYQSLGPVTVSAGVAVFPDHGATVESLLQSADMALYVAKQAGRDRVCLAEAPHVRDDGAPEGQ